MKPKKNDQRGGAILEGSRAIALTIKNIGPAVVSAYPITPQTHIVEDLARFRAEGQGDYEYVRAESEFAAASIILGASAAGARVYSATSSQGLLLMAEVVYNIAGLRLPIVMTCANRAVSAPINIWNDHSDAMAVRDAGWIQLFAENHQEAVYQHVLAYKIAEKLNLPVMVNVDGFILTHSYETVDIPSAALIKKYLPARTLLSGGYLDPANPVTMGGFFSPEAYFEAKEDLWQDMRAAAGEIKTEYARLKKVFQIKNNHNGLVELIGNKKAKTLLVAMGSVCGTIQEALKDNRDTALLKISSFRPFPAEEIRRFAKKAARIAVIEKAATPGTGGALFNEIKSALYGCCRARVKNYLVGLGGVDVSLKMIKKIAADAKSLNKEIKFIK